MIAIPAIDLRSGACVQLVGGEYDREMVRLDDPVAVARSWAQLGFHRLHLVDLDAATGRGTNTAMVNDILAEHTAETQVGGGVRDAETIERLLTDGAARVVVGTKALEEPDWLSEVAQQFPHSLVVAADVRDRRVVTRGWARTLPRDVCDVVEELNALPLAGMMVTAVHREGQMLGPDLRLMEDVAEAAEMPVYASGGVGSIGDLRALADRGVAAVIIGMALYTGAIDARTVAEEFFE